MSGFAIMLMEIPMFFYSAADLIGTVFSHKLNLVFIFLKNVASGKYLE